jgi:hypothetical protein
MPLYIRVKQGKSIMVEVNGRMTRFVGGDWVSVGKQDALRMVADGRAEIPQAQPAAQIVLEGLSDCGIAVWNAEAQVDKRWLKPLAAFSISYGVQFSLPYSRTLIWDGLCPLRPELVPVGFYRLTQGWQLAVPLVQYKTLAQNIGTDEEQARTQAVIKDLRVPVYDTRLMYVQRCSQTEHLFNVWQQEFEPCDDLRLAFLRAAFQCIPVINTLPATWTQPRGR